MRRLALFAALALPPALACNQIVGIEAPVDEAPAVAPPTGAAAFVGRWRSDAPPTRDHLTACRASPDVAFNGTYTFDLVDVGNGQVRGTNADTPACQLTLATSGSKGTLVSPSMCTFAGALTVTYTLATFTLSAPSVGELELAGDAVSATDACKYDGKFTLRRVASP
jgi:hypothetical protein